MVLKARRSRHIRLIVALALVIAIGASALPLYTALSATWPNCNWGSCGANDVSLNEVYFGDASGAHLTPCTSGSNVTAYIWGNFTNNTGTSRYAVWLIFDLWLNGSLANSSIQCDLDVIAPGSALGQIWGPMSWECGQEARIKNLIVSWVGNSAT
jgi:hypothetical protein